MKPNGEYGSILIHCVLISYFRPMHHIQEVQMEQEREQAKKLVHQLILLAIERPGIVLQYAMVSNAKYVLVRYLSKE
jgi:hypothetical protein